MITCFSLSQDQLKSLWSKDDPPLWGVFVSEKPIGDYQRISVTSLKHDYARQPQMILHNATTNQHAKYQDGLDSFGNAPENIVSQWIEFVTDNELLQQYLYSELHQGGILNLSRNAVNLIACSSIQRTTVEMDGRALNSPEFPFLNQHKIKRRKDYATLTGLSENALKLESTAILSDVVFNKSPNEQDLFNKSITVKYPSPHTTYLKNFTEEPLRSPLFTVTITLYINLEKVQDSKEIDSNAQYKIAIEPEMKIYVIPGKEEYFNTTFSGYIGQFQKSTVPVDSIGEAAQPLNYMDEECGRQYILDELSQILFKPSGSVSGRIETANKLINFLRQNIISEQQLNDLLNMKDQFGKTLLHDAYSLSEPDIALFLLQLGADPYTLNNTGYSFATLWNSNFNISMYSLFPQFREKRGQVSEFLKLYTEKAYIKKSPEELIEEFVIVDNENRIKLEQALDVESESAVEGSLKKSKKRKKAISFSEGHIQKETSVLKEISNDVEDMSEKKTKKDQSKKF